MKKTLVTGADGFIGSHLAEQLARGGAKVRALALYNSRGHWGHLEKLPASILRKIEVVTGDVADPFYVDEIVRGCETVYHLAALIAIPFSYTAPDLYVATNVRGTVNVLQACRRHKVARMLHTSTSEVYGTARYAPIDEAHPLQGQSPYSASKIGADMMAESFHRSYGLPVTIARPFNTYGPRQSARAVIPTILTQALSGAAEIKLGDTRPVRDFNYVQDTVEGMIALARSKKTIGQTVNLGSGRGVTIAEIVRMAGKVTGRKLRVVLDSKRLRPEKSEVFKLVASRAKAARLAGWRPKITLEEGLKRTTAYLRTHLGEYKPGLYNV